jgi:hypothetical protein
MKREYMLVAEGNLMTVYRANIKIKINGSVTNTWIEIEAVNANTARALLQAQYGKENVINVIRKSWQ